MNNYLNQQKQIFTYPHSIAEEDVYRSTSKENSIKTMLGERQLKTMIKFGAQRRKNTKGMKLVKHTFNKRNFSGYDLYQDLPSLPRIQEQKSLFEESNLYVSTFHLLKGLETITFASDEEQKTFWFALPKKAKIKDMHRFQAEYDLKNSGFAEASKTQDEQQLRLQEQPMEIESCAQQDIQVEQHIYEIEREELRLKFEISKMEQPMRKLQSISRPRCKRTAVKKKVSSKQHLSDDFSMENPSIADSNGTWISTNSIVCSSVTAKESSSKRNPSFNPLTGSEVNEILWLNRKSSCCLGDQHSRKEQAFKLGTYFVRINDFLQKKTSKSLDIKERQQFWSLWYSSRFGYDEKSMEDIMVFLGKYEAAEPSKQFIYAAEYEIIKERKENIDFLRNYRQSTIDPQQI